MEGTHWEEKTKLTKITTEKEQSLLNPLVK